MAASKTSITKTTTLTPEGSTHEDGPAQRRSSEQLKRKASSDLRSGAEQAAGAGRAGALLPTSDGHGTELSWQQSANQQLGPQADGKARGESCLPWLPFRVRRGGAQTRGATAAGQSATSCTACGRAGRVLLGRWRRLHSWQHHWWRHHVSQDGLKMWQLLELGARSLVCCEAGQPPPPVAPSATNLAPPPSPAQAIATALKRHPSIWITSLLVALLLASGGIIGVIATAASEATQRRQAAEGARGGGQPGAGAQSVHIAYLFTEQAAVQNMNRVLWTILTLLAHSTPPNILQAPRSTRQRRLSGSSRRCLGPC